MEDSMIEKTLGAQQHNIPQGNNLTSEQETMRLAPMQAVKTATAADNFKVLASADAGDTVNALINKRAVELAECDAETREEIANQAKTIISDHIEIQTEKTKQRKVKAKFEGNAEACETFGIKRKPEDPPIPLWQQRWCSFGDAVWFVVFYMFAFFTIAPINRFSKSMNNSFKNWVALIIALIFYAALIIGMVFLIRYVIKLL